MTRHPTGPSSSRHSHALHDVSRTIGQSADPIALAFEAFEPRFEAADPDAQRVGIRPPDSSTLFDRDGIHLSY